MLYIALLLLLLLFFFLFFCHLLTKEGVALTGCNTTGPPYSVGRPTDRALPQVDK